MHPRLFCTPTVSRIVKEEVSSQVKGELPHALASTTTYFIFCQSNAASSTPPTHLTIQKRYTLATRRFSKASLDN